MSDTYRSFVYRPYYYYFEDVPYFESKYVVKNDVVPKEIKPVRVIKLKDGTLIEAFSGNDNSIILFAIIICIILLYFAK